MPNMHHQPPHSGSRGGKDRDSNRDSNRDGNIVSLCHHRQQRRTRHNDTGTPSPAHIVRLSPEYDGIELLYANDRHPDKLFSLKVLAWAMRDDDSITAMVPWLKSVVAAEQLADPLNGRWMGYRLPGSDYLFTDVPDHKVQELNAAVDFFGHGTDGQQIPDTIGTHAVFSSDGFHTIRLVEVVSWKLTTRGEVHALVADETEITRTPVLPGDPCLSDAQTHGDFCYFFQHGIANRIKDQDPEALAAIATLAE